MVASAANANNVQSFEPATNSTDDANYDDLETNARTAAREPLEFNMALVLAGKTAEGSNVLLWGPFINDVSRDGEGGGLPKF